MTLIGRKHLGKGIPAVPPETSPGEIISLMHYDDTNGSTSFIDETGRTWTRTGTGIAISTLHSVFGGSSLYSVSGTARSDIRTDAADFALGNGAGAVDFETDFWLRLDGSVDNGGWGNTVMSWRPDVATGPYLIIGGSGTDNTGVIRFSGSTGFVQGATTLSLNTDYHILLNRYGGFLRIYLNGVLDGSGTCTTTSSPVTTPFALAGGYYVQSRLRGYLEEFRFVRDAPERTSNFTPPVSAYTYP